MSCNTSSDLKNFRRSIANNGTLKSSRMTLQIWVSVVSRAKPQNPTALVIRCRSAGLFRSITNLASFACLQLLLLACLASLLACCGSCLSALPPASLYPESSRGNVLVQHTVTPLDGLIVFVACIVFTQYQGAGLYPK